MIVRKDQPPTAQDTAEGQDRLQYSDTGGLTQYGAHIETLQPGTQSSERHYHEDSEEFLYVMSGEATVIEEDGAHQLGHGDAACWPAGVENAHQIVNRSDMPCTYLIVGTRVGHDVVHYPDLGRVGYRDGVRWWLYSTDGTLIMEGSE